MHAASHGSLGGLRQIELVRRRFAGGRGRVDESSPTEQDHLGSWLVHQLASESGYGGHGHHVLLYTSV
jgi:hypothetical protein